MYDKSQQGKGKRLGDTDEEERWRQSDKTQRTARAKFARGGFVSGLASGFSSAYAKASDEYKDSEAEREARKKNMLRSIESDFGTPKKKKKEPVGPAEQVKFKKGGMVKGGRDYRK